MRTLLLLSLLSNVAFAQTSDYALHFPLTQKNTRSDRFLNHVGIRTLRGTQQQTRDAARVYSYSPSHSPFVVHPGETLHFDLPFSTGWMHGYIYLDRNQNGRFDLVEGQENELISYSYYQGKNSRGAETPSNVGVAPPSYTLPHDLSPGIYRLRFKVDWNNTDPAGALSPNDGSPTGPNGILKNGGAIADVLLNVQTPTITLQTNDASNTLKLANGEALPHSIVPGQALTLSLIPPEGQLLNQLTILSGYAWDSPQTQHGNPQWQRYSLPGYLLRDGKITIPASLLWGNVRLQPTYVVRPAQTHKEGYALSFPTSLQHSPTSSSVLQSFQVNTSRNARQTFSLSPQIARRVYQDFTRHYDHQVSLLPGDKMELTFSASSTAPVHAYLYVDLNQDGQFTPLLQDDGKPQTIGELVAYNHYQGKNSLGKASPLDTPLSLPAFTLPEQFPTGVYRARLVLAYNSIDPAGHYDPKNDTHSIEKIGGHVIDFLLNVHLENSQLQLVTEHGNIYGQTAALPNRVPSYQDLNIRVLPVAPGYDRTELTIRHGHHLDGPQYIHGNRQWEEFSPALGKTATSYTLPAHLTDANVRITARFAPGVTAQYLPILVEEFEQSDGSQPNEKLWKRSVRYPGVTWARFISNSKETVFVDQGELVCRALPTPESEKAAGETQPVISGSVETRGLFAFQYGKVEGRIRTHKHAGNFPAFWMMPTPMPGHKGWPWEGEIDIWEQIDSENVSHHTIHTNWTYNLKHKNNPQSSFRGTNIDMNHYHTYGVEWTPTQIKWTVDGQQVGVYKKSSNKNMLNQGQWPFDRKFYLILNQSVGNGSWAKDVDPHHIYETRFDWVRVYQTKAQTPSVGVEAVLSPTDNATPTYYDLSGRRVSQPSSGLYIVNGQKVLLP